MVLILFYYYFPFHYDMNATEIIRACRYRSFNPLLSSQPSFNAF